MTATSLAFRGELLRRLARDGVHWAEAEQRDFLLSVGRKILDDLRLADLEQLRLVLDRHAFRRARG